VGRRNSNSLCQGITGTPVGLLSRRQEVMGKYKSHGMQGSLMEAIGREGILMEVIWTGREVVWLAQAARTAKNTGKNE